MPKITFIEHNGTEHTVQADIGQSVMQAARNQMVPGIIADCGGTCSCATCHVYVDPAWVSHMPAAQANEIDMLECVVHPGENGRLSCCIHMTPELDGLVVRLPESQT